MQNPLILQRGKKNENGRWQALVVWEIKKERIKCGESNSRKWGRIVFITYKQSLEDFLLEISFHEKLKINT